MTQGYGVNSELFSWLLAIPTLEISEFRTEINEGKPINTTAVKCIEGRFLGEQSDFFIKLNALFKTV